MPRKIIIVGLSVLSFTVMAASPYAGQQNRQIKALSGKEVSALLAGKGMGLAKAGELNHYPGPKHVLELGDKLELSNKQLGMTQALFSEMKNKAIDLGKKIVEKEQLLDQLFATQSVSESSLKNILQEIGQLRAELRYVHLKTHLQQRKVLSEKQLQRYDHLRGYSDGKGHHHGHEHH